jgi:AraC-like DNA-binding protein
MSAHEEQLHPSAVSQVMINFTQHHGVDKATCLLGTGISEAALSGAEGVISRAQEMRLIENIMLAIPEGSALGFELGLQYSLATFGVWGFALRTSKTLRDALQIGIRYLPLSTAYCKVSLIDEGDEFGISLDPDTIPSHLRQFLLERDMATTVNLIKELSLSGFAIKKLEFIGRPSVDAERIEQLCGITPIFAGKRNSITVNRAQADLPFSNYDAELVLLLEQQCRLRMQRIEVSGVDGKVRQKLLGDLGLGASLDEVASALAMSPRTLRRKLEQEGGSYRDIVDEERKQIAIQLLENTSMKIDDLAAHLGFMDSGGFVRAFRRWSSCSPSEYREARRAAD